MSTIKIHDNETDTDLEISENMPEIYADGISNLIMGGSVSKVTFHSVKAWSPVLNGIEQRKAVLQLSMPTVVLFEMCRNILFTAQTSEKDIVETGKITDARYKEIMEGVSIVKKDRKKKVI